MSDEVTARVVDYYEAKLAAHGATARGVDWKDEASQRKRFEQLVRALGLARDERFSLVDYGCGYGALLSFLDERGFACDYTGYDRSAKMIEEARRAHGDRAAFTTDWSAVPRADYVVASGIFNVRFDVADDEWRAYVEQTLASIHERAVKGWVVNFLTIYSDADRMRRDLYYADPAAVFAWCQRNASRWVSLFHDYDLYEFTLGVARAPR